MISTRESQFAQFVEHPLTHVALVAQVAQSSFKSEYMKTPPGEICRMDVVGPPPPSLNLFFTQNSELQASNIFPLVHSVPHFSSSYICQPNHSTSLLKPCQKERPLRSPDIVIS